MNTREHIGLGLPSAVVWWWRLSVLLLVSIGCDGVIGSSAKKDKCGECAGHNTSCHIISGIFTRAKLSYGYNKITTIPKGACNVNITETKYSRNYLAVKSNKSGKGIINGDWRVSHSKTYPAAGTSFTYYLPYPKDSSAGREYIRAKGPLTEKVDVLVLAFTTNPGITYEYTIPSVKKKKHGHHGHHNSSHSNHSSKNKKSYLQNDRVIQRRQDVRQNHRQPSHHSAAQRTSHHQRQSRYPQRGYHRSGPTGTQYAEGSSHRHPQGLSRTPVSRYSTQRRPQSPSVVRPGGRQHQTGYPHVISAYKPGVVVPQGPGSQPLTNNNQRRPLGGVQGGAYYGSQRGVQQPHTQYVQPQSRPGYGSYGRGNPQSQYYPQNTRRQYVQNHGNQYAPASQTGLTNPYFQVQQNPGVMVPPLRGTVNDQIALNLPDTNANVHAGSTGSGYSWRISGFTKCSHSCGGGTQQTIVVCVRPTSQAVVTDDNCNNAIKPGVQSVSCNQNPCPPSWVEGDWSACSKSCDKGTQSREVSCKQRLSATLHLEVNPSLCRAQPKPIAVQVCEVIACVRWKIGDWGQCSAEFCGRGQRSREVVCVNAKDRPLPENKCPAPKPHRTEICDMGSCAKTWFYSEWAKECSSDCGEGKFTRKVICTAAKCNPSTKPKIEKACKNDMPCGGKWFTGPWGKCSVSCGEGSTSRDVACMKKLSAGLLAVVGDENCIAEDKPQTSKKCQRESCKEEWYMTDWSKCSRTCNTGHKTREVKCLDAAQRVSLNCKLADKPSVRHTCNTSPCPVNQRRRHHQRQSDPRCKDKFPNCRLVVQARLCGYAYYKRICCATCESHKHHHHDNKK